MILDFNELPWHDANLLNINVDRERPGENDIVRLSIIWPNNTCSILEFYDCYALTMNMNFGIVAEESILSAECCVDSQELSLIKKEWLKAGINLEKLKCFKINTNSTNSTICIFSLGFKVIKS